MPTDPDVLEDLFRNPEIEVPPPPESVSTYAIRVDVADADPPIWRRLVLRSDLCLHQVHEVLQLAFGWEDMHLHRFFVGEPFSSPYFTTRGDRDEGETGTPEEGVRLDQVMAEPGQELTYVYDFGDGWTHTLRLESVDARPADDSGRPARCPAGSGAGPLEDSGGIHGYNETAAWVRSGHAPDLAPADAEDLERWLPPGFDPDGFSVADTDAALGNLGRADITRLAADWPIRRELAAILRDVAPFGGSELVDWLSVPSWRDPAHVPLDVAAAAVRPWQVLLRHLGEGVTLTGAGYLPTAVVSAVFDELDITEPWMRNMSREDHNPPVRHLREQAQALGLLRKAKGRLAPTALARRIGDDPVALWWEIASRLPLGKLPVERHGGWLYLLAAGAGDTSEGWERRIGAVLSALGWQHGSGGPLDEYDVWDVVRSTRGVLDAAAGALVHHRDTPQPTAALLARCAVLGRPPA